MPQLTDRGNRSRPGRPSPRDTLTLVATPNQFQPDEPRPGEPEPEEFSLDELEMDAARRKFERQQREAWGTWRQDREQNRRKVLRSLIGLLIGSVLAGVLAYGCSALRAPREVRFADSVSGFELQPATSETDRLAGQLEAAGATGPEARYYRGTDEVLLLAGYSTDLPTDVVASLLPPVTTGDNEYQGRGGPLECGATADGSRCVWKSTDLVGGTSARGMAPDTLEKVTRDLRAGAIR
jgi:hypothetical protein